MTAEELKAIQDLAAAINNLASRLPQPNMLAGGGWPSPLFTVRCECHCSRQPYYTPNYGAGQHGY